MGEQDHKSLSQRLRRRLGPLVRLVIPSRLPMVGPYPSYAAALAAATGYDSPLVTQLVEEATLAVLEGRAAYERDGVAFASRPPHAIHTALQPFLEPGLTIADFGGGLGGLFINAPELFPSTSRRLVIEQASMVASGRRISARYGLGLHFIDATVEPLPPIDVLIASSVLQYLPDPWEQLSRLLEKCRPAAVVLDRTSVHLGASRWYLQTNPGYYREEVTYPIQVLDRERLRESFPGYRLEKEWHNSFDAQSPEHVGWLFIRDKYSP